MKLMQFIAQDNQPGRAIVEAREQLDTWWQAQDVRFTDNGSSFFQVSASMSHMVQRDGSINFLYCITVFDPRD